MKYKVILAGYEGSKNILAASSYLINKYLRGFDVYFLNYGDYDGDLFTGTYVKLDDEQKGGNKNWSKYMREYLETLDDKYVIFGLDDYFLRAPIDMELYDSINMDDYDSVNLCKASVNNGSTYSCTTQYTIWDRELLIDILSKVATAWQFEDYGSIYLNGLGKRLAKVPAMDYNEYSALSSRWNGIKTDGSSEDDIEEINKLV